MPTIMPRKRSSTMRVKRRRSVNFEASSRVHSGTVHGMSPQSFPQELLRRFIIWLLESRCQDIESFAMGAEVKRGDHLGADCVKAQEGWYPSALSQKARTDGPQMGVSDQSKSARRHEVQKIQYISLGASAVTMRRVKFCTRPEILRVTPCSGVGMWCATIRASSQKRTEVPSRARRRDEPRRRRKKTGRVDRIPRKGLVLCYWEQLGRQGPRAFS